MEQHLETVLAAEQGGTFEVFFQSLAEQRPTAHLVQFFDSTVTRSDSFANNNASQRHTPQGSPLALTGGRLTRGVAKATFTGGE